MSPARRECRLAETFSILNVTRAPWGRHADALREFLYSEEVSDIRSCQAHRMLYAKATAIDSTWSPLPSPLSDGFYGKKKRSPLNPSQLDPDGDQRGFHSLSVPPNTWKGAAC